LLGFTIVVPALNEEAWLGDMVRALLPVLRSTGNPFEIIIVNDGSIDQTGQIADQLATENTEIRVVHYARRQGLGFSFRTGISEAKFDYLILLPGDGAYDAQGLVTLIQAAGSVDLVVGYRTNQLAAREPARVLVSRIFQWSMMLVSGQRLRDFHAACVYPVEKLRKLTIISANYTYQVETLTKLLRQKVTFVERPVLLNPNKLGGSRAVRLSTLLDFAKIVLHLWGWR